MDNNRNLRSNFVPPPLPNNPPSLQVEETAKISSNSKKMAAKRKYIIYAVFVVLATVLIICFIYHQYTNGIKQKLISNTAYVKEHMIGIWKTNSGDILEVYENGWMVNYKPVQNTTATTESMINNALANLGCNGYTIPEISSYTKANLKSYAKYLKQIDGNNKIGISIQANFFGVMPDKFILFEFSDDNNMFMGGSHLTRVEKNSPVISDSITGIYSNIEDKGICLNIIETGSNSKGYFEWSKAESVKGFCNIYENSIALLFSYADDFIFKRDGSNLVEIGSNETPGSQIRYEKISDLSYLDYKGETEIPDTSLYQDYILKKAEELTGFKISWHMDNYDEGEYAENGQTYITIDAFINIDKTAETNIQNYSGVFRLIAVVNKNNENDLFLAITSNSTGEIYRYDHSSVTHDTSKEQNISEDEASHISADELSQIEEMLNTPEVNGFVARNFYDNVESIDLELVFREYHYGEAHTEEIDDEYMLVYSMEELYSPISAVSSEEIKEIYKKYTGKDISDGEIKHRLQHYNYLPKYDVYCDMHGDTSYNRVTCVDGTKEADNTYVITVDYGYRSYEEGERSILTLKKHGDSYIFISNLLIDTD